MLAPSKVGAIDPVGMTKGSTTKARNTNASTNATRIDSIVSRTLVWGCSRGTLMTTLSIERDHIPQPTRKRKRLCQGLRKSAGNEARGPIAEPRSAPTKHHSAQGG